MLDLTLSELTVISSDTHSFHQFMQRLLGFFRVLNVISYFQKKTMKIVDVKRRTANHIQYFHDLCIIRHVS